MERIKLTFNAIDNSKKYDKLSPKTVSDRTGNYIIRDYIKSKWDVSNNGRSSTCGNIQDYFVLSENGIVINKVPDWNSIKFGTCISSPMLLYRCVCTFPDAIVIADNYKYTWTCNIIHKTTKCVLILSEWKGTPNIVTTFYKIEDAPIDFVTDLLELINYLLSDQCAHPYDNTVAGTQA